MHGLPLVSFQFLSSPSLYLFYGTGVKANKQHGGTFKWQFGRENEGFSRNGIYFSLIILISKGSLWCNK